MPARLRPGDKEKTQGEKKNEKCAFGAIQNPRLSFLSKSPHSLPRISSLSQETPALCDKELFKQPNHPYNSNEYSIHMHKKKKHPNINFTPFAIIALLSLWLITMLILFKPKNNLIQQSTTPSNPNQEQIQKYQSILQNTWNYYKSRFIQNGQVIDPSGNITTSEGQSYALFRAWYLNDKQEFDTVWQWTKTNIQLENKLFAWKYQNGQIIDPSPASDADQDIATALLLAYEKWNDPQYLTQAQEILTPLWDLQVITLDNKPYLISGPWANYPNEIVLNPSYLSPAQYRHYAKYDQTKPWLELISTSYEVVNACTTLPSNKIQGVLPAEWCSLNKDSKTFTQSSNPNDDSYGFNAIRTPLRIALDYHLNKEQQAKSYLDSLTFLNTQLQTTGKLLTAYTRTGQPKENYESALSYAGNFGYFLITQPEKSHAYIDQYLTTKYLKQAGENAQYWEDPNNYYTQNIAWFATALYLETLKENKSILNQ